MAHYIDADRLRAEIERHIKEVKEAGNRFHPHLGFFDAKLSGIYDTISIIDSLQQEQPEVDLEKEIDKEWRKCCPTDEGMGDEKAILVSEQFYQIASHFAEWGRKQVLQEIYEGKVKPVDKITATWLDNEQNT